MVYMLPLATVIKHFRCVKCVLEKWEQSYHCTNGDEKKNDSHILLWKFDRTTYIYVFF